jgi:steroid delta-isomerase-like uncharacterized protein
MTSKNIRTAMKFYSVYNDKDLSLIDDLFTEDYVGHVNSHDIVGSEAAKGFIGGFIKGIPDANYEVKEVFEIDDRVICRWTCTGTQTDVFYGMPASNNSVDVNGITIFRIDGDKIAELWNVWDQFTLVEQLKK